MTDTWMERYVHKYGNRAVYQELLEEFKAASDELFQFPKQFTPEQIEVLNRYLVPSAAWNDAKRVGNYIHYNVGEGLDPPCCTVNYRLAFQ